jgi:hypothetical protein
MTKPANIEAIEKTTEFTWDEWMQYLEKAGAKDMEHRQIADLAYKKLKDQLENAGWWSQSVAVAYEQEIGRRAPGQRSDGTYEFSVSKTMEGSLDDIMAKWLNIVAGQTEINGIAVVKAPTTTEGKNRRHWGCGLADGSRLNADVWPAKTGKYGLFITHQKLKTQADADQWKAHWKACLQNL